MKVEIELPELPDGWEYTGEYRYADEVDYYPIFGPRTSVVKGCTSRYVPVVKRKRWRAKCGDKYWYLSAFLQPARTRESGCRFDDQLWRAGNYFKSKEEAEDAAEKVIELLLSLHE